MLIHGDANLRNAILLDDGRVALLDLEHLAVGPAAADLGQVVAERARHAARRAQPTHSCAATATRARPARRCAGTPPRRLLARVALPAVGRVRPDVLARLKTCCAGSRCSGR